MTIKLTQHIDLPPIYVCPTCLNPMPFQAGEKWQVCEENHLTASRGLTFANGEDRQVSTPDEKRHQEWRKPVTPFQEISE
jgi:hypothetical protein